MARADPQQEAVAWFATLSQRSVTTAAVYDFHAWRRKPRNKAAYLEVERAEMWRRSRFAPAPDPGGNSAIEKLSGKPAQFANRSQSGISEADAEAICEVLNRRAAGSGADPG